MHVMNGYKNAVLGLDISHGQTRHGCNCTHSIGIYSICLHVHCVNSVAYRLMWTFKDGPIIAGLHVSSQKKIAI